MKYRIDRLYYKHPSARLPEFSREHKKQYEQSKLDQVSAGVVTCPYHAFQLVNRNDIISSGAFKFDKETTDRIGTELALMLVKKRLREGHRFPRIPRTFRQTAILLKKAERFINNLLVDKSQRVMFMPGTLIHTNYRYSDTMNNLEYFLIRVPTFDSYKEQNMVFDVKFGDEETKDRVVIRYGSGEIKTQVFNGRLTNEHLFPDGNTGILNMAIKMFHEMKCPSGRRANG